MNNFKAIIFDMDGLLVDSEPVWEMAEIEVIEKHGNVYNPSYRDQIVGLRMDEFTGKLAEIYRFPLSVDELIAEIKERMCQLIPEHAQAQPGSHEIIAFVKDQNIPRAIASSSPKEIIDVTVQSGGWDDVFTVRCSAEEVPKGKPAPDVYLEAARRLGIPPEDCLALEDSPNGARAAIAAGLTCYAIPDTSHTSIAALEEITPHVFLSLYDVLAKLQSEQ